MCPPKISSYSMKVSRGVKKVITANLNLNNDIFQIRLIVITVREVKQSQLIQRAERRIGYSILRYNIAIT